MDKLILEKKQECLNQIIFKILILNKCGATTLKTGKTRMTTLKSKFEFISNQLNEALTSANTTTSEQKKAYYLSRALYYSQRLSTLAQRAKISA